MDNVVNAGALPEEKKTHAVLSMNDFNVQVLLGITNIQATLAVHTSAIGQLLAKANSEDKDEVVARMRAKIHETEKALTDLAFNLNKE